MRKPGPRVTSPDRMLISRPKILCLRDVFSDILIGLTGPIDAHVDTIDVGDAEEPTAVPSRGAAIRAGQVIKLTVRRTRHHGSAGSAHIQGVRQQQEESGESLCVVSRYRPAKLFVTYIDIILLDLLGHPDPGRGGRTSPLPSCNINVGATSAVNFQHWRSGKAAPDRRVAASRPQPLRRRGLAQRRPPGQRVPARADAMRAVDRAKKFAILEENSRADDGRVKYLAGRGLPGDWPCTAITTQPRRTARTSGAGRWAMVAWAVDEGNRHAGQVLEMALNGDFKKAIDGKKVRLTYARIRLGVDRGFRVAAEPAPRRLPRSGSRHGGRVGGARRGYLGPIYAVLGKGNPQKFAPPGPVLLLADRDVGVAERRDRRVPRQRRSRSSSRRPARRLEGCWRSARQEHVRRAARGDQWRRSLSQPER